MFSGEISALSSSECTADNSSCENGFPPVRWKAVFYLFLLDENRSVVKVSGLCRRIVASQACLTLGKSELCIFQLPPKAFSALQTYKAR